MMIRGNLVLTFFEHCKNAHSESFLTGLLQTITNVKIFNTLDVNNQHILWKDDYFFAYNLIKFGLLIAKAYFLFFTMFFQHF